MWNMFKNCETCSYRVWELLELTFYISFHQLWQHKHDLIKCAFLCETFTPCLKLMYFVFAMIPLRGNYDTFHSAHLYEMWPETTSFYSMLTRCNLFAILSQPDEANKKKKIQLNYWLVFFCRHTTLMLRFQTVRAQPQLTSAGLRLMRALLVWVQELFAPSVTPQRATRSPPFSDGRRMQVRRL